MLKFYPQQWNYICDICLALINGYESVIIDSHAVSFANSQYSIKSLPYLTCIL